MKRDDAIRLYHMAEALTAAVRFAQGRTRLDVDHDEMLRFALTHAIQIVGEAASKISAETQAFHPQIPWRQITGMRNRLVHAYYDVDRGILWTTATVFAPELLALVQKILPEIEI